MYKGFSANIRALREDYDLTQQQLADNVKMSAPMISHWENKGAKPSSKKTIKALCELFNVNEQDLFGYSDGYYAKTRGVVEHLTPQSIRISLLLVSLLLVSQILQSSKRAKRSGALLSFAARVIFLFASTAIRWIRCYLTAHMRS